MRSSVRAAFEVRAPDLVRFSDLGDMDAGLAIEVATLIAGRRDYERGRTGLVRFARPVIMPNKRRAHGHRASLDNLSDLLRRSHFVVLALPLSTQSEDLIGKAELKTMRGDAWLINISRGRVVDEDALTAAVKTGTIGGVCLDVFRQEPLPEDSELWSLPNVIVTPHNSGWSPLNLERGTELFLDNLSRFVAGRPLRNRVRARDF